MLAEIVNNKKINNYSYLTLKAPMLASKAKPGQFVSIKIPENTRVFWRRPFSICQAKGDTIELLIKKVGPGTDWLTQRKVGETMDIIGPQGQGFSLWKKMSVILIGGGCGVAPLFFLAQKLSKQACDIKIMVGGQSQKDILLKPELKKITNKFFCSTIDGSTGHTGKITEVLQNKLAKEKNSIKIAASGPVPMLKAVAKIAEEYKVYLEVCLEEVMACGLGVCNGCVVKVGNEYKRVCYDGPVFPAHKINWEKM